MSDGPAAADHLSLDALAELEEGIADDAAALRRHLDGCATCRRRAGQLNASRALLSTLPADPMPADVVARIDAALAAEPQPARAFVPGGDIVPTRGRRSWLRGPNLAAAAAGVAVLALGAALVVGHTGGKGTNTAEKRATNTAAGPAAPATNDLKQWQTGANYTAPNRAGLVAGLLLGNPPPLSNPTTLSGPRTSAGLQPSPSTSGPPSYDRAALRQTAAVFACAALLAGAPTQPLAVDYARYDGVPAVILVLPDLQHPETTLDVYVIRTACSDAAVDTSFFTTSRPR